MPWPDKVRLWGCTPRVAENSHCRDALDLIEVDMILLGRRRQHAAHPAPQVHEEIPNARLIGHSTARRSTAGECRARGRIDLVNQR
jgi:hypothetical protein